MLKLRILAILMSLYGMPALGNRYNDFQADPSILVGASGADDTALAVMVFITIVGGIIVKYLFEKPNYTPVKEVLIYVVVCIFVAYIWMVNN
jgi:hypothetical protein